MVSLAFPDHYYMPTFGTQFAAYPAITSDIRDELGLPESLSRLGHGCLFTTNMAMPKTAMYKNYRGIFS
jgi:hypothetical protein